MSENQISIRDDNSILSSLVKYRYPVLLVLSALLITLMTYWTTPYSDDWHFGYIYERGGALMQRPIQTLGDMVESLHNYYLYKDGGRCVTHSNTMFFLAFIGHNVFAVCNGLMFALMLHLFCLNFAGKNENYFTVASIALTYFGLFLPAFKDDILWLDGSCNYLWSAGYILLFHYLLSKDIRKAWWPLLFVYGIIAGNTNEGIMIGLSVGYMVYYLSHFKQLTPQRWVMLIGLAIGVALLVFSPGAWNRAAKATPGSDTTTIFAGGIGYLYKQLPLYFMTIRVTYIAVFLMLYKKKFPLLWGSTMMVLALFCLIVRSSERIYFGLELTALIVVLQLLDVECIKRKYALAMASLSCIVMMASLPLCAENYYRYRHIEQCIRSSKNSDVTVFAEERTTIPFISDRFVLGFFSEVPLYKKVSFPCKFYSKKGIHILPMSLSEKIANGKIGNEFDLNSPYSFYVREWDGSDEVTGKMTYSPSPYASYPILNKIGQFTIDEQDIAGSYIVLNINSKHYLIIEKSAPIAHRIKSIEVSSKE